MGKNLSITYIPISELKPYKKNAKKHPPEQVEQIERSIEEFGMNDPIAVWGSDNEIVEGHGRLMACKNLGFTEVPIIRLDNLTDEQRKAYTLIHNQLTMNSDFDLKILSQELDGIFNIDMGDFGFDVEDIHDEWEDQHEQNKDDERFADANILNLERAQFEGVGKYDIPELQPVTELPEIEEWIGFNYMLTEKHPEKKAVHFFVNDYQFERIWNNPDKYVDRLRQFAAVASPDFSPYGDMPFCLQLYNHYRKHWVGRYLQECGITVIPTITANYNERSLDFFLDGEPHDGIIIMSSMWTKTERQIDGFKKIYTKMFETLNPKQILLYGKQFDWMSGNITRLQKFTEKRWNGGGDIT